MKSRRCRAAGFPPALFALAARPLTPDPSPRRGEGDWNFASRSLNSPRPCGERVPGGRVRGQRADAQQHRLASTHEHTLATADFSSAHRGRPFARGGKARNKSGGSAQVVDLRIFITPP
jgi:hypothetical protein